MGAARMAAGLVFSLQNGKAMGHQLVDAQESINLLVYGDGGTGKTSALCGLANLGRILVINAEGGVKRRALEQLEIDVGNIEVWPSPGEDLSYKSLENEWLRVREVLHADPDAYVGVIWDSITEIHKALLDHVVERATVKAQRAGRERDRFFIDRGDYGIMTEQMRLLIRRFRDLPCHFGMSALSRREQDQNDGSVTYQPAVTPALQNDIIGWVDIVGVTSVELVGGWNGQPEIEQYRGLFRPHGKYRGKDRLNTLPKWLVDPSFDRILEYIDGTLTIDQDAIMQEARALAEQTKQKQTQNK